MKLACTHALDGTILTVNDDAAVALGVDAHSLAGRNLKNFLSGEGCAAFAEYVRRIVRDGEAEGTMIVRAADGRLRTWEYHNVLESGVIEGHARDITESETILRALVESEEQFRLIIENVSDVITVIDPDGTVRYATPSVHALGYAPHEVRGRSIYDFIHPSDAARAAEFFAAPAEAIELRFRHAGGSQRLFEVVARNVVRKGQVTSIIATARDITERRKLQNQLATENRMASLGRLAATVAHEFNNVLMSIMPFAELMKRRMPDDERTSLAAHHIFQAVKRGRQISQEIHRFAQPASLRSCVTSCDMPIIRRGTPPATTTRPLD